MYGEVVDVVATAMYQSSLVVVTMPIIIIHHFHTVSSRQRFNERPSVGIQAILNCMSLQKSDPHRQFCR